MSLWPPCQFGKKEMFCVNPVVTVLKKSSPEWKSWCKQLTGDSSLLTARVGDSNFPIHTPAYLPYLKQNISRGTSQGTGPGQTMAVSRGRWLCKTLWKPHRRSLWSRNTIPHIWLTAASNCLVKFMLLLQKSLFTFDYPGLSLSCSIFETVRGLCWRCDCGALDKDSVARVWRTTMLWRLSEARLGAQKLTAFSFECVCVRWVFHCHLVCQI